MEEDSLKAIVKTTLPEYALIPNESLTLTYLFSGTNKIHKLSCSTLPPIIIRQFGQNPMIDTEIERFNFSLVSSRGICPPPLFSSPALRIESFIPGTTLCREECGLLGSSIMPALLTFHSLSSDSGPNCILQYLQMWRYLFYSKIHSIESTLTIQELQLVSLIKRTIEQHHEEVVHSVNTDGLVFSHNDFSYGNIIKNSTEFHIIDYEYSGLSHPSVDLASFIIETMFDFSTPQYQYFPEQEMPIEQQLEMIGTYADLARIDSDELWNDTCKSKAIVSYLGMLWAGCKFTPGDISMLQYAEIRQDLFKKYRLILS